MIKKFPHPIFNEKKNFDEIKLIHSQKNFNKCILAITMGEYKIENISYLFATVTNKELIQKKSCLCKRRLKSSITSHVLWDICTKILQSLKKKRSIVSWFLHPVDIKKVPDYHMIIKHPMDFDRIQFKIKRKLYNNPLEFRDDIRLIWSNCKRYNPIGTIVRTCGDNLSRSFERKWMKSRIEEEYVKKIAALFVGKVGSMPLEERIIHVRQANSRNNLNKTEKTNDYNRDQNITFEGKRNLSRALGKVQHRKLKKIFNTLFSDPFIKRISRKKSREIEANIDMLTPETLSKLSSILKRK